MRWITGIKMQSRISMIQNGKGKMSRTFLRTHEELNFSIGVDDNSKSAADTNQRQLDERASPLPGGSSSCWRVGEQLWQSTAAPPLVELDRKSRWKDQQELARPAVRFSLYRSAWQHRFERRLHYQAHLTV
jgi:hypothetical protein